MTGWSQAALARARQEAYRAPGRAAVAVDRLRTGRSRQGVNGAPGPPPEPQGVLVTVAHWRSDAAAGDPVRFGHLLRTARTALELDAARRVVAVTTNEPLAVIRDLQANLDALPPGTTIVELSDPGLILGVTGGDRAVAVLGWRPGGLIHRHPFHLTWAHKPLIRHALADPGISHFVYLEDDEEFTSRSLAYWCRYRAPLARHGLIPGFARVEPCDGDLFVIDQLGAVDVRTAPRVVLESQLGEFIGLPNPYQGMYVLDRPLALEHFERSPARDPVRSLGISHWDVRARAALGPTLDDLPAGFAARNVVRIRRSASGACELDQACAIEHLAGNYSRTPGQFGNVRIGELFRKDSPA